MKEKSFVFKLKDLHVIEDFSIWAAWDKRNQEFKNSQGEPMKFPIREGTLQGTDKQMYEVDGLKYMKQVEFKKLFPDFAKSTTYNRHIIVNGEEYICRFKMTSNNKLLSLIDTISQVGGNPLDTTFQQTFDKNQSPANMYNVVVYKGETNAIPQGTVVNTSTPTSNKPPIQIDEFKLNEREKEVVDAIKSLSQLPDKDGIVMILRENGIDDSRTEKVYNHEFKKG